MDRLQYTLETAGVRVWRVTLDLWPGEDWRANIRQAITDDALVFIACFSRTALRVGRATRTRNSRCDGSAATTCPDLPWLIPVRFDDCNIPDHDIGGGGMLGSIQRADLFGKGSAEEASLLGYYCAADPGAIPRCAIGRKRVPRQP